MRQPFPIAPIVAKTVPNPIAPAVPVNRLSLIEFSQTSLQKKLLNLFELSIALLRLASAELEELSVDINVSKLDLVRHA